MKWCYKMEFNEMINRVVQGDSLSVMKDIPDDNRFIYNIILYKYDYYGKKYRRKEEMAERIL